MLRRDRKKIETKKRISEIALALFFKKGLNETSVLEITEEADLGTGTFYNYFKCKEDILKYCLSEKINEDRHILVGIQQSSINATLKVSKILSAVVTTYEVNTPLVNLYMQFYRNKQRTERREPHGTKFKEILSSVIREGQEKGEFRNDIPTEIITEMYNGILGSTTSSDLEFSAIDNITIKLNLLLEGLSGVVTRQKY